MDSKDNFLNRITQAKSSEIMLEDLINEYKPFIKKTISKVTGRFVNESDDLYSIGLLAFKDAIFAYDPIKGKFIHFADLIIRSRSIDYLRKENRIYEREVYDNVIGEDFSYDESVHELKRSLDQFSEDQVNALRKLEIQEFVLELNQFDIKLDELVEASPKQQKLRNLYISMAKYIVQDKAMVIEVKHNKKIPIKELEKYFSVNRKKIERGRKYIIALTLILTGDYQLIQDYIKWGE